MSSIGSTRIDLPYRSNLEKRIIQKLPIIKTFSQKLKEQAKTDYETEDLESESEDILFARMIFGEGADCSKKEKIAIAYSAINRKKWGIGNLKKIILTPKAYSCFNKDDDNLKRVKNPLQYDDAEIFENCLKIARGVLNRDYKDPTDGATHYFNPKLSNPEWANKMEKTYFEGMKHIFCK